MRVLDRAAPDFLYQQVVDYIDKQQSLGLLRAGDKLPSLRKLSKQLEISVSTVKQAYEQLERQGTISAKPQSGYYLNAEKVRTLMPRPAKWKLAKPTEVKCRDLIERVYQVVHRPDIMPFGISNPIMAHSPDKALARQMRSVLARAGEKALNYGPTNGDPKLRTQLAYGYQEVGVDVSPDDFIVTNGAQEALTIALQCCAQKGDVIAIESPCYFGIIELIESLGMKAVEVYTSAEDGVSVDELEEVLLKHEVKVCLFSTAINNPLGSMMTDVQRQQLVALIERYDVTLIEDDVYGDLYFGEHRPKPAQLYSEKGLVMTCSSFSKTAAPSYRVGWIIPGKYLEQARRVKRALSCTTPILQQWTISEYVSSGEYDRYLAILRRKLQYNSERMRTLIAKYFPEDVCISKPQGGSVLWVRCRSYVDTDMIFDQAIEQGVSFAPGRIFSPMGHYHNYMRISYGIPWSDKLEQAVKILGDLVKNTPQPE